MNIMTDQQRQNVTDAALVEMMTECGYWDHDIGTDGISMETFLRNCFANEGITNIDDFDKECKKYAASAKGDNSLKILCSAYANNERFRNTVILDADENNGAVVTRTTVYNETTEKDEHTYTVAFCGTRKGYDEWPDNAEGLLNESSAAQRSAANYFDMVSSRFEEDANVVVTGHSKGGNKAQYVTMFASNRDLIDGCVAFDGQGFSKEAMDAMQEHDDYIAQRNKITRVCGSDDYVHVLGERLAKAEQTYYLEGDHRVGADGVSAYANDHLAQRLFRNQDGIYTCELKSASEQGALSKLAERLFQEAAETLPPDTFAEVARGLMDLLDGNASGEDITKLIAQAGPLIEGVLLGTPEGRAYLNTLPHELLSEESRNALIQGDSEAFLKALVTITGSKLILLLLTGVSFVYSGVSHVFEYISDNVDDLKYYLYSSWGIGPSPYTITGPNIAAGNETLKVDTQLLSGCASKLRSLRSTANDISERLQSAFERKRAYQTDAEMVVGGIIDTIDLDWSDLKEAQRSLSTAAKGMSAVAGALGSMSSFLENAETAATKYGGLGG